MSTTEAERDPREEVWQRYPNDALEVPENVQIVRCRSKACNARVWWGQTRARGKPCPFDVRDDGTPTLTSHWRTCADREPFRRKQP